MLQGVKELGRHREMRGHGEKREGRTRERGRGLEPGSGWEQCERTWSRDKEKSEHFGGQHGILREFWESALGQGQVVMGPGEFLVEVGRWILGGGGWGECE